MLASEEETTSSPPSCGSNDDGYHSPNGSLKATETHTHLSKDGFYYYSYQEMCDANHRSNQRHLKSLGLLHNGPLLHSLRKSPMAGASNKTAATRRTKKSTPRKAGKTVVAPPVRRSGRLRKEEPAIMVSGNDLSHDCVSEVRVSVKKKKRPGPRSSSSRTKQQENTTPPLTAAQRQTLSNLFPNGSWLKGLETYLLQEDQISHPNFRNVMRQAEKLASGQGITYPKYWGPGVAFAKGECIDLTLDFDALYARAVDCEDEHGRDLGNGWLLRHPITKLANFQSFCLLRHADAEA